MKFNPFNRPRKFASLRIESRSVKMMRETLCAAQSAVQHGPYDERQKPSRTAHIQTLIDELDRHRPTGRGGKHGNLHTPTCGCSR
jgi:hypothetical protein